MTSGSVRIAAASLLVLASCAPKRSEVALNTDLLPASSLVNLVDAKAKQLKSLVGRGSLTFESPEAAGSAFFSLSVRKPDSLLVRLIGPFGMDLGTLFLSRRKFVMYNSMENVVTTGVPTQEAIRSVIPFDVSYDELMNAFTGAFGIERNGLSLRLYEIDDGRFHLSYADHGKTYDYWVDPRYLLVTKVRIESDGSGVIMEAVSSSVKEEDNVCAPRRVTITFPGERRQLSIAYTTLALNTNDVPFSYSIPPSARPDGEYR